MRLATRTLRIGDALMSCPMVELSGARRRLSLALYLSRVRSSELSCVCTVAADATQEENVTGLATHLPSDNTNWTSRLEPSQPFRSRYSNRQNASEPASSPNHCSCALEPGIFVAASTDVEPYETSASSADAFFGASAIACQVAATWHR